MSDDRDLALLRRLDAYGDELYARTRRAVRVGPFTCFIHPTTDLDGMSTVHVPGPFEGDLRPHLEEVIRVFADAGRTCAFEYFEDLWPDLLPVLLENGFGALNRYPVMVVSPEDFVAERVPGLEVRKVRADDDLWAVQHVGHLSFENPGPITDAHIETMRRELEAGEVHIYASFLEGVPVGVGIWLPVIDRISLITFVATLPEHRGRGIAGRVTSVAIADAIAAGAEHVWLTAGGEGATRLYERLGFRRIGMSIDTRLTRK